VLSVTFYFEVALHGKMGKPFLQWFIPLVCLWLIITFTKYGRLHFCILYISLALGLSYQYLNITRGYDFYTNNYIGYNRIPENLDSDMRLKQLKKILLTKYSVLNNNFNANWINDTDIKKYLSDTEE